MLISAGLSGFARADWWQRTGYGLVTGIKHYVIDDLANLGGMSEWRPTTEGYDPRQRTVSGSTNEEAPWTAKFTPLSNETVWAEYGWEGFWLQPGYRQHGLMTWSTEIGFERWSWTEDPFLWPTYRRDRDWHGGYVWSHRVFPNSEPE